jgi:hypothetical protein
MSVPGSPSVASRAIYFPAQGTAGRVLPPTAQAPNNAQYIPPVPSGDIVGPAAGGLPAVVIQVGSGGSPDFAGTILLVHDFNGVAYTRTAGQFGLVSTTTWAGAGSPVGVAHWQLIDALA